MRVNCFIFTVIILLLSACSTQAERKAGVMRKTADEIHSTADACGEKLYKNPSVQLIVEKVVVKGNNDGYASNRVELSRNPNYLTDNLQSHFIIYLTEVDKCNQIILNGASRYDLRTYKKLLDSVGKMNSLAQQLIDKKINIGEFNTKRIELRAQEKQDLLTIQMQINSDLDISHNAEVQKRAQEGMEAWDKAVESELREREFELRERESLQRQRPIETECYSSGNRVNCTTR